MHLHILKLRDAGSYDAFVTVHTRIPFKAVAIHQDCVLCVSLTHGIRVLDIWVPASSDRIHLSKDMASGAMDCLTAILYLLNISAFNHWHPSKIWE